MGLEIAYDYGQTPLSHEELEGLIPGHISTHKELNEWESSNILEGRNWALSRNHSNILSLPAFRYQRRNHPPKNQSQLVYGQILQVSFLVDQLRQSP